LEEAEPVIRRALALTDTDRNVLQEAAEIATRRKSWKAAADYWSAFFRHAPTQKTQKTPAVSCFMQHAQALRHLDRATEALAVLDLAMDKFPGDHRIVSERNALEADRLIAARREKTPLSRPVEPVEINVQTVCHCFWDIERDLDLLTWSVNDIFVWPLIRIQVYYAFMQDVGLYDAPHPGLKTNRSDDAPDPVTDEALARIAAISPGSSTGTTPTSNGTRDSWLSRINPFGRRNGTSPASEPTPVKRSAVLMATRKLRGSETYTEALRQELGDEAILLDRPLGASLLPGALDFDRLTRHFKANFRDLEREVLSVEDRLKCQDIREAFIARLDRDIPDLADKVRNVLSTFIPTKAGFKALWEAYPVHTLYLTNAYGISTRAAMVALQEMGGRGIEFQHGFISEFHMGYSWPGRPDVPYSPNELWCFGDYWHQEATPLAKGVKGRTIGAPYVKTLASLAEGERDPDLVVFSSQGVIGRRLLEWAIGTARGRSDKRVIFRLHPSEILEEYQTLLQDFAPIPDNFSLSHKDPVIFALLAKADTQVGAFSTTLLEGISLGTKTVVVDLPGIEYMRPVIERGDALFVRDVTELIEKLDDAPLARDPFHYYAPPLHRLT
jgi:hypothetical protein